MSSAEKAMMFEIRSRIEQRCGRDAEGYIWIELAGEIWNLFISRKSGTMSRNRKWVVNIDDHFRVVRVKSTSRVDYEDSVANFKADVAKFK